MKKLEKKYYNNMQKNNIKKNLKENEENEKGIRIIITKVYVVGDMEEV